VPQSEDAKQGPAAVSRGSRFHLRLFRVEGRHAKAALACGSRGTRASGMGGWQGGRAGYWGWGWGSSGGSSARGGGGGGGGAGSCPSLLGRAAATEVACCAGEGAAEFGNERLINPWAAVLVSDAQRQRVHCGGQSCDEDDDAHGRGERAHGCASWRACRGARVHGRLSRHAVRIVTGRGVPRSCRRVALAAH
jgi:hypothetical protein